MSDDVGSHLEPGDEIATALAPAVPEAVTWGDYVRACELWEELGSPWCPYGIGLDGKPLDRGAGPHAAR